MGSCQGKQPVSFSIGTFSPTPKLFHLPQGERGWWFVAVQLLSHVQLCHPMDFSTPGSTVLLEFAQIHVYWVSDDIQPSHLLSPSSPPAFNLSQPQGLFLWVNSLHQVAKILELQHQSFQWIFKKLPTLDLKWRQPPNQVTQSKGVGT